MENSVKISKSMKTIEKSMKTAETQWEIYENHQEIEKNNEKSILTWKISAEFSADQRKISADQRGSTRNSAD